MIKQLGHRLIIACLGVLLGVQGTMVAAQTAVTVTYYHNDLLGSPVAASDASGNLIWEEDYAPYGDRLQNDTASAGHTQWYTGKHHDEDTGLTYMGARYYDPSLARFISVDPVDFQEDNPKSFNRYTYANNNPYAYTDPDGNSPIDVFFLGVDTVNLIAAVYSGDPAAIQAATADVIASTVGVISPIPGTGQAIKATRVAKAAKNANNGVTKNAGKPDFIVSPKGTTMPTNKDFNLVDSNKKGGDWFQIHNKHTDAKVDGSPHTHYPKQHGGSRTREIKRTDGGDLDRADSELKNGTMRERRNRKDKGG